MLYQLSSVVSGAQDGPAAMVMKAADMAPKDRKIEAGTALITEKTMASLRMIIMTS
jgi:hypothetical protein